MTGLLWVVWLYCTTCAGLPSDPNATPELSLRIVADVNTVEFGEGFPVTVIRTWSTGLTPEPWSDVLLEPLHVEAHEVEHRELDGALEETHTYRCRAFTLEDVILEELAFEAVRRDGTAARATAPPLAIHVQPSVNREDPGAAEWPPGPWPLPASRWRRLVILGLGVFGTLVVVALVRRNPKSGVEVPGDEAPASPQQRALARLAALQDRQPAGATESYFQEAAALLRDFLEEEFGACQPERTTEEVLASPATAQVLGVDHRQLLAEVLTRCDRVKFGGDRPGFTARSQLHAAADRFLRDSVDAPAAEQENTRA